MPYRRNVVFPRIIAAFVDSIVYSFLISISQIIFRPFDFFDDNITEISLQTTNNAPILLNVTTSDIVISVIIALILGLILFVYIPYQKDGKTIGKIVMGIRVIDEKGDNPNIWQHMARAILIYGQYLYFIALIILLIDSAAFIQAEYVINIGYSLFILVTLFMIISSPDSRGPHDLLAKTYVVDQDYDPKLNEADKTKNPKNWAYKETENKEDDFLSQYDDNNPWDR